MAWYPGATKLELQPESDAQPKIRPTQFIVHSLAASWTAQRTYEFWRDSTNLESHFGVGYAGDIAQYIGTETRADANAAANLRADGTGAVSLESASNTAASDPWTDAQVDQIVKLGLWLHQQHNIPVRLCRTADDPGFGYHRQFSAWNPNGHTCPGDARVTQFKNVVIPMINEILNGGDTVALTDDDAKRVWSIDFIPVPWGTVDNPERAPKTLLLETDIRLRRMEEVLISQQNEIVKITASLGAIQQIVNLADLATEVRDAVQKAVTETVTAITAHFDAPTSPTGA